MMKRIVAVLAVVAVAGVSGCRIQVDKNKEGSDKNVKIDTPMGGLHVRTDQLSAADVGLPAYPGAQQAGDKDNEKSADVHMGFGKWQLRVKVATYKSSDSQDQVLAFYKKALGRYGDVVQCNHGTPVGTPAVTRDGLSCSDDHGGSKVNVNIDDKEGLKLLAGSKHHQHVVEFKNQGSDTHFSLIELELPSGMDDNSGDSQ